MTAAAAEEAARIVEAARGEVARLSHEAANFRAQADEQAQMRPGRRAGRRHMP